jgi:hypothetical protein
MRLFRPASVGIEELKLLLPIAVAAGIVSVVGFLFLASQFDGDALVPKEYWDKLLSVVALSSLPLVGGLVIVVRSRLREPSTTDPETKKAEFAREITYTAMGAFVGAVFGIVTCVYFTARTASAALQAAATEKAHPGTTVPPYDPGDFWIWISALDAGLTLAAAAVVVAATALNMIDNPRP